MSLKLLPIAWQLSVTYSLREDLLGVRWIASALGIGVEITMTNQLIAPHGGELVLNMADEAERAELQARAKSLPEVGIGSRQLADLEMLAIGAYSPLGGFMKHADYLGVVNDMHLENGLPWSIPITLSATSEQAAAWKEGSQIALVNEQGALQAVMTIEEKYAYDKQHE